MTNRKHISGRIPRRFARVAIVLSLSIVALVSGAQQAAGTGSQGLNAGRYPWPVKPFDRQHPVRGSFGDPRTVFAASPNLRGVMTGGGSFSLHTGIDVAAPDGTAVYPVVSGTVDYVNGEWVRVQTGGGRAFEYWHIRAAVHVGDRVEAQRTVLGRILRGSAHVHLTELENGRSTNPLAPGHIGPYADHTTPLVTGISIRRSETTSGQLPNLVRGRVVLVAGAADRPTLNAPDEWSGLPVAPALITWRIKSWNGNVVRGRQVAADFRDTLASRSFWQVYARGTYQNMAVFGRHYSWAQPGAYLFRLTPRPFDTHTLRDGPYDLVVTATDIRGNSSSLSQRFTVANHTR